MRLVRLDEEDHLLLVTLHHSVADGWLLDLLVREFGELYGAHVTGQPLPLGTLAVQYADYAVWQRACCAARCWSVNWPIGASA
ncbi:MAG: condensation domain-containing protein [Methylotetracoccus sp.]